MTSSAGAPPPEGLPLTGPRLGLWSIKPYVPALVYSPQLVRMGACTVALAIVVHTTPIALTLLDDRDQPALIMYVVFCFSIPVPIQY